MYVPVTGDFAIDPRNVPLAVQANTLRFMEESDSEAFHIYSKALLEFNQEGLSDWINYLKTIF